VRTKELAHRTLLRTFPVTKVRGIRRVWGKAQYVALTKWGSESVETELHGSPATINFANPYPYLTRLHPNYNAPQVELVATSADVLGRPVTVIDIGAAIGDTALLLLQRCGPAIRALECIEGEPAFAEMLRQNLQDPRSHIHEVVLSDRPGPVPSLIRSQHEGTASAHGDELVTASTLDVELADISPDVMKVDTDGFDGIILAGGKELLERAHPAVLFEWHPPLCKLVGADPQLAFEVLREAGYDRWVFFTKYGWFSHFGDACVDQLERLCLTTKTLPDWHYDVVALHRSSNIDEVALADLRHWGSSGYP
jgi:FkbM family methyltransferase